LDEKYLYRSKNVVVDIKGLNKDGRARRDVVKRKREKQKDKRENSCAAEKRVRNARGYQIVSSA
jgi:hypothetical protein